jgi:murein DD-endopeptidase MepM/ murein hydrolase activator NlpD
MRSISILVAAMALAALDATAARAVATEFDVAAAFAKSRRLVAAIRVADPAPLWAEASARLRATAKDSTAFAVALRNALAQFGAPDSCLDDHMERGHDGLIYLGRYRSTTAVRPLSVLFAYDSLGRVNTYWVIPEPDAPVRDVESRFKDYVARTRLGFPAYGEWTVLWGGRTPEENRHVGRNDQYFAYDLVMTRDGATHRGDGKRVEDYYCYGQPVVAPARGLVVWAEDGWSDQPPGLADPKHPVGNALVIAHEAGEFSVIAHLQPGSERVVVGDSVAVGDTLGLCGNSGDSSEPHLHVHLQNSPVPLQGDGLPAAFDDVVVDDQPLERAEPVRGQRVHRADWPAPVTR